MPELETRIEALTVYTDRARVRRRGRIALDAGSHQVVLQGLPINVVPESVRASARATVKSRLLGTDVSRTVHPEPVEARPAELQAQIETLEDQDCALLRRIEAFTARRKFLQSLADSLGSELARGIAYGRSTVEAGASASTFLGEQFAEVDAELQSLDIRRRTLSKELEVLRARLQSLGRSAPTETQQITVAVMLEVAGELELDVSYQVTGARWEPLYDLRVSSGAPGVGLSYMAQVSQNTGEAWEGASLSLSTAKPALSLQIPELNPWFLHVYAPMPRMARGRAASATLDDYDTVPAPAMAAPAVLMPDAVMEEAELLFADTEETGASVTFHLGGGSGIPSDGSPHKVLIGDYDLPGRFDYVTAPRQVAQAYRRVRVTNSSSALLLPGAAQIFDGEEYVGSTRLKTVAPGEEFELFLGVDDRIKVERKLVEGSVDKKLLVDVRRMTYAYEIKVQNLTQAPQTVTVWDQQPVSRHEQMKVRRTETRPAPVEETELGKLRWELQLAPAQEATIRFGFVIEAPRDLQISGLPPLKD